MSRAYVRAAELVALQERLSGRELTILEDLERFRLLRGDQVRRLHFPDDAHASASAAMRAANAQMRRLVGLGLVKHLERRVGGVRAGSSSYVWYLSAGGRRLVAAEAARRSGSRSSASSTRGRIDARHEPGLHTALHTLAVAELAVRLIEEARAGRIELAECVSEPGCWRSYLNVGGGRSLLKPDLFVVVAVPGSDVESVFFIEVDRGTESRTAIARKAEVYEAYRRSGQEQVAQGVFPRVAWVVMDDERATVIREVLTADRHIETGIHTVATLDQFLRTIKEEVPP